MDRPTCFVFKQSKKGSREISAEVISYLLEFKRGKCSPFSEEVATGVDSSECEDAAPFVNLTSKYVYLLTKVDGKKRNEELGIKDEFLNSKNSDAAKRWYRKVAQLVHPDKLGGDRQAFEELTTLYSIITDY